MASAIDATKPTSGTATTASVRTNFSAAESEINALQNRVLAQGRVSLNSGGSVVDDFSVGITSITIDGDDVMTFTLANSASDELHVSLYITGHSTIAAPGSAAAGVAFATEVTGVNTVKVQAFNTNNTVLGTNMEMYYKFEDADA